MKRRLLPAWLILLALISLFGCQKSNDGPPDPGTPVPPPIVGTFSCDQGTLIFKDDGQTVNADFTDKLGEKLGVSPGATDYSYGFCWYNFGPCRWDVAPELRIYNDEAGVSYRLYVDRSDPPSQQSNTLGYVDLTMKFIAQEVVK